MTLNIDNCSGLMKTLASWIAGDFSNQKQAFANPQAFAHIHVFFRPLDWNFFDGIGFYSEQVYDYNLWTPYRQGVHRFIQKDNEVYIENYSLKDTMMYAGSGHNKSILDTITPDAIERRYNCSMVFRKQENIFYGRVEGNQCLIKKGDICTYLISEVELTEQTFVSLDRGIDVKTDKQIWGSNHGPLRFEKVQNFADELPEFEY